MEGRFTQRLGSSGVVLCFPGSPGIIGEKAPVVFFSVWLCPSQAWNYPKNIWGIPLIGKTSLPCLNTAFWLILTQGIQSDHSPPFRLAGFQDNWWQLIYLSESTRGGRRAPLYSLWGSNFAPVCFSRLQDSIVSILLLNGNPVSVCTNQP